MLDLKDPVIKKAYDELELLGQDEDTRDLYEARLKAIRDEDARIRFATNKGLQQGIEQGIKQGIEQGELANKTEIARKMMASGIEMEQISEITGLTTEQLGQLQN